jgi:hypothetical protein
LATPSADGYPLNRNRADAANVGLTVDYQPQQEQGQCPRLAVVAGSASRATSELAGLLHRRLRFLSILFAGLLGIVTLVLLITYSPTPTHYSFLALRTPAFAITALLAIILWSRKTWPMMQLRLMELLLFGTLIVYYLIRSYFLLLGQGILPLAVELVAQERDVLAQKVGSTRRRRLRVGVTAALPPIGRHVQGSAIFAQEPVLCALSRGGGRLSTLTR